MKHSSYFILLITLSLSLGLFASTPTHLRPGFYILYLRLNESLQTPVRLEVTHSEQSLTYHIRNHTETIELTSTQNNDSLYLHFPVFNSYFSCQLTSDSTFTGYWNNLHKGPNYKIPFQATIQPVKPVSEFFPLGKWEVFFSPSNPDSTKSVGLLSKDKYNNLTGTFLTETGDYRYLQGEINNGQFYLSCLDGSHLYHFTGKLNSDSSISDGTFHSGTHWYETWHAIKNPSFELRDPNQLTFLNPGYDKLEFSFPDLTKKQVSLDDQQFKNKVVIVQLMGSWCPNCLDESRYFNFLYNLYNKQGLEIIALAYEAKADFNYASTRVKTLRDKLNSKYTFLIAGTSNKTEAQKTLPMLNQVISFPTSIIIDRKGKVRNIYTGFYGPGTGPYYEKYTEETERLIKQLLKENP